MTRSLTAYRLGRVEYEDGLRLQDLFAEARRTGAVGDVLLLLEHPPVLTLGRGAARADILKPPVELEARGVEVRTATGVTRVGPTDVGLSSGETVRAHTLVWAGGLRANPVAASLPIHTPGHFGIRPAVTPNIASARIIPSSTLRT